MNYLAHAYLSFHHPEILVGNMISDFIKGKKKDNYNTAIQKGIMLHRAIDNFTDMHQVTREAKQFFRPVYGLYAGAFMDIVYDHFLATDENIFPGDALMPFSEETYAILDQHVDILPERFKAMLPSMKKHNWLYNYRLAWGIQNSFKGLVYRAAYMNDSEQAFNIFENNYMALQQYYRLFFPEIKQFAWAYFSAELS